MLAESLAFLEGKAFQGDMVSLFSVFLFQLSCGGFLSFGIRRLSSPSFTAPQALECHIF